MRIINGVETLFQVVKRYLSIFKNELNKGINNFRGVIIFETDRELMSSTDVRMDYGMAKMRK